MFVQREWELGANRLILEEPDLLIVNLSGPTTMEDAQGLVSAYRDVGTQQPFFLIVNTEDSTIGVEARSYLSREARPEWFRGIVYAGMGLVQRSLGKAITMASSFKGRWTTEVAFTATEAEAREAIARMRAKQSGPRS